ncbi:MAG: hypothetical protein SFW36_02830 [Leptolyngbyaceae cyanobacterium bins.59]|nr:hypothetical protein [Leptolyngbyaceae cyanobacterium bins.59]
MYSLSSLSLKMLDRRALIDELLALGDIAGRLDLLNFLRYTWDLDSMPSTDYRFSTAAGDIWDHIVSEQHWSYAYLFHEYFDLDNAPESQFFCFLESIIHPVVRPPEEQQKYVEVINKYLSQAGYHLLVKEESAGYKFYHLQTLDLLPSLPSERFEKLIFACKENKFKVSEGSLQSNISKLAHLESFLIYEWPVSSSSLLWIELVDWWAKQQNLSLSIATERSFYQRLRLPFLTKPRSHRLFFELYLKAFRFQYKENLPALLPQVYLQIPSAIVGSLEPDREQIVHFLMRLSEHQKIVIHIDDPHAYVDERGKYQPHKHAEIQAQNRELGIAGYEVYFFTEAELRNPEAGAIVEQFFRQLFQKYEVKPN